MRWVYLAVTVLTFAACGVQWFPEDKTGGGATTAANAAPTFFNFTSPKSVLLSDITNLKLPLTKSSISTSRVVVSNTVTVKGTKTDGWPFSFRTYSGVEAHLFVSDTAGGPVFEYQPNQEITDVIFPDDTLTIEMVPTTLGGSFAISSITVGTYTTNFIVKTIR